MEGVEIRGRDVQNRSKMFETSIFPNRLKTGFRWLKIGFSADFRSFWPSRRPHTLASWTKIRPKLPTNHPNYRQNPLKMLYSPEYWVLRPQPRAFQLAERLEQVSACQIGQKTRFQAR